MKNYRVLETFKIETDSLYYFLTVYVNPVFQQSEYVLTVEDGQGDLKLVEKFDTQAETEDRITHLENLVFCGTRIA